MVGVIIGKLEKNKKEKNRGNYILFINLGNSNFY